MESHTDSTDTEKHEDRESEKLVWPGRYTADAFYAPDSEENILLQGDNVIAATFPKLVHRLTLGSSGPALLNDFLLTYRSFTASGADLLRALVARDAASTPADFRIVRLSVLKIWTEKYWYDFHADCPQLGEEALAWLKSICNDPAAGGGPNVAPEALTGTAKVAGNLYEKLTQQIKNPLAKRLQMDSQPIRDEKAIPLFRDPNIDILDCPAQETARQLSLMEWRIWCSIKAYEFLDLNWKKNKTLAFNALAMIKRFDYLSSWTATRICIAKKLRDRAKIMSSFIHLAYQLKSLNNFNGFMAIYSGLNSAPVQRLKQTFAEIDKLKDGTPKMWHELQNLANPDQSYAAIRQAVRMTEPPCIPYLNTYLQELTSTEESNPNFLTAHKLINFQKRKLTSNTINNLLTYQNLGYNFADIPEAQLKLRGETTLNETTLMELSMYLEPPRGKERGEKPQILITGLPSKSLDDRKTFDLEYHAEWKFFTQKQSSANTILSPDKEVIGLNKYKIVEKITSHLNPDKHNTNTTLATFTLYMQPTDLLELLILRFRVPQPQDKSEDTLRRFVPDYQSPIQLRVANTIKTWISTYWYHFLEDPKLKQRLIDFIRKDVKESLPPLATSMEQELQMKTDPPAPLAQDYPEPLLPTSQVSLDIARITDFNPLEVARQLTLILSEKFLLVRPEEFWASTDEKRPNLLALGDSLFSVQAWALEELNKGQRDNALLPSFEALAKVAMHCGLDCANWQAVFGIFNAFSVFAQENTWSSVDPKVRKFYQDHKDLLSEDNKQKLQALHMLLAPPCIPYIAFYQDSIEQELQRGDTMIGDGVVNILKMKKLGDIVLPFIELQKGRPQLKEVQLIQDYLNKRREITNLVRVSTAKNDVVSAIGGMRALFLDLLHNEEQVKLRMDSLVSDVIIEGKATARETALKLLEAKDLSTPSAQAECIGDLKLRQALLRAFPGGLYSIWTYHDDQESDNQHYLLYTKDKITAKEVVEMTKLGSLYQSQHKDVSLSCILVAHEVCDTASKIIERCKIKVLLV